MMANLTCTVSDGPHSEWVNGTSLFGELSGGYVFKISVTQAQRFFSFLLIIIDYLILLVISFRRLGHIYPMNVLLE